MLLQRLDNLDPHLQIVLAVAIDQLADVLPLWSRLPDDLAVVTQKMRHEVLVEVLLELLDRHLGVARRVVHRVDVDLLCHVLAHLHQVGETVVDRAQFLQHYKHVSEEHDHLVRGGVQDLHDQINVSLKLLNELIDCGVTHFVDRVEEMGDEVTIDFQFLYLGILTTHEERGDFIIQVTDNGLALLLWVSLLVELIG